MRDKMTKEKRKQDSSVIVIGDDSELDLANWQYMQLENS